MYQQTKSNGFGIVEMLVSIAIFLILVLGGSFFSIQGFNLNRLADQETQATYYSAEGLEAVRSIANQSWPDLDIGNTACNGTLQRGVTVPTTTWDWTTFPQTKNGLSRTITLGNVCRDGSGNISIGGSVYDANVKKVTSTVTWSFSPTRNNTVRISNYLSNFRKLIPSVFGDWSHPSVESVLNLSGNNDGLDIGYSGNFAYIIRNGVSPNFSAIDISTTAPVAVGGISLTGNPTSVFVHGNFAYVTSDSDTSELQIVNISNPTTPTLTGVYNAIGNENATDVFVDGTTAYMTRISGGDPEFVVINVSNPAFPTTTGSLNLSGNANGVTGIGNTIVVASSNDTSEVEVISVATPSSPTLIGAVDLGGNSDGSTVIGATRPSTGPVAMVGRLDGTVSVITTTLTSTYGGAGGAVNDIALSGNSNVMFLATTAGSAEFQVVDVSNLSAPFQLSLLNLADQLNGIVYDPIRDRAYAASKTDTSELIIFKPQ